MTVLNPTTAAAALLTLGDAPDTTIDSKVWQELLRVRHACQEMANLIDAVNSVEPETGGTIGIGVAFQDIAKVSVIAGANILAQQPVYFYNDAGVVKAKLANTNTKVDGFAVNAVNSGQVGEFTLFGVVGYSRFISGPAQVGYPVCLVSNAISGPDRLDLCGAAGTSNVYVGNMLGRHASGAYYLFFKSSNHQ